MRLVAVIIISLLLCSPAPGADGGAVRPSVNRDPKVAATGKASQTGKANKKPAKQKYSKKEKKPVVTPRIGLPESLCDPLAVPRPPSGPSLLVPPPTGSGAVSEPAALEPFFSCDLLPELPETSPDQAGSLTPESVRRSPLAGVRYRLLPHATLNLGYAPRQEIWSQAARPFGLLSTELPREERISFGIHIDF